MNLMKFTLHVYLLLLSLATSALAQQPLTDAQRLTEQRRQRSLGGERLMTESTLAVQDKSMDELKAIVKDTGAAVGPRCASARLLLRREGSLEQKLAAFPAFGIHFPNGVSDGESVWTRNYPVAAEAALHPELMPHIIQGTLDGDLVDSVAIFTLRLYEGDNHDPGGHLVALLKTNLTPQQRQRGERLLAMLNGETPPTPANTGTPQAPSAPDSNQSSEKPVEASGSKPVAAAVPVAESKTQSGSVRKVEPDGIRYGVILIAIVLFLGLVSVISHLRNRKKHGAS